jgi:hypothetical protein
MTQFSESLFAFNYHTFSVVVLFLKLCVYNFFVSLIHVINNKQKIWETRRNVFKTVRYTKCVSKRKISE